MSDSNREDWDTFFIHRVVEYASRSTCPRLHCGAVFVDPTDHVPLIWGYNGALHGQQHCSQIGCILVNNHCVAANHAEQNAIAFAAKKGIALAGSELYVTHRPCVLCCRLALTAGVVRILYKDEYRSDDSYTERLAASCHVPFLQYQSEKVFDHSIST